MVMLLDLNEISAGKTELKTFQEKLETFDIEPFLNQEVQIKGCAPVWAYLLVAARLFGKVKKLEYLIDNRKDGIPLEIYHNSKA